MCTVSLTYGEGCRKRVALEKRLGEEGRQVPAAQWSASVVIAMGLRDGLLPVPQWFASGLALHTHWLSIIQNPGAPTQQSAFLKPRLLH